MAIEISQALGSIKFNFEGFDKTAADITSKVGGILTKVSNVKRNYETQSIVDAETGDDVKYNTKMTVDDITVEFALGKSSDVTAIEAAFNAQSHTTALISNKHADILVNCQLSSVEELGVDPAGTHIYNVVLSVSGKPKITRKFA
ncbi:TPA: hypothetical protein QHB43_001192 [Aeromonas hydrophila subsp. hydrophila]|nr:hypothetical protein [Aeromonas hydrophila subsp. hydrophila]